MASFKIGITMAGAISAGAYTAGVLDFLTEALDEWYAARARGEAAPPHDVSIEVFSGASAGGMCAAISAVMLHEDFDHIHDITRIGTNNRFYESWVNRIDICELLKTDDLAATPPVISLLDSTIIQQIAEYALSAPTVLSSPKPYVSSSLTLFLSLTNLRGTPYSLNGSAPGSIEETTFFYGDRIRFEAVRNGADLPSSGSPLIGRSIHPLNLTTAGRAGGWDVLQSAAMATGAFPMFLAPRVLSRWQSEYTPPLWEPVTSVFAGTPPPIPPNFPDCISSPFQTLNVDGGITNNDPFNYAHDYLASLDPPSPNGQNSQDPVSADRAVLSIAPFPTMERYACDFDARKHAGVFSVLSGLFSALVAQSRFYGESLTGIMNGTTFSRFVIAPSDGARGVDRVPALQCATAGAFGGFFARGFRAHDYALGRRNCQKFLRDSFVLPANNVILSPALAALAPEMRETILKQYARPAPGTYAGSPAESGQDLPGEIWLPVIPLCSDAVALPLPPPDRAVVFKKDVEQIVSLMLRRFRKIYPKFLQHLSFGPLRIFLVIGKWPISILALRPLRKALIEQLGGAYRQNANEKGSS